MRCAWVPFIVLFIATTALAAEIDGKWTGTIATPNGDFMQTFTFKADGQKLAGFMTAGDGSENPIHDGKIEGDKISFELTLDFGGMPIKLTYTGMISGEQIKLSGDAGGLPFALVLNKTK